MADSKVGQRPPDVPSYKEIARDLSAEATKKAKADKRRYRPLNTLKVAKVKNKKEERFPAIYPAHSAEKLREGFLFRVISRVSRVNKKIKNKCLRFIVLLLNVQTVKLNYLEINYPKS